ncbi:MAG: RNA 2',3'-cyclic phosphodiesterase [Candidatus Thermoplasmatota archaeon]|nr:RNA 2',3'-cyclic phosphodiesterase [Candidatus Thermoplasmatota archaeon]
MRSFVAISLPQNDLLTRVISENKNIGKTVEGRNMHLTLKFLGEISDADKIADTLDEIRFEKFTLTLKGLGAFPSQHNGRVLFVMAFPEDKLGELAARVDSRTRGIPLDHPFTPHITLLRAKERRDFSGVIEKYGQTIFMVQDVSSFCLYESKLTPTGPIYREIRKYQLM